MSARTPSISELVAEWDACNATARQIQEELVALDDVDEFEARRRAELQTVYDTEVTKLDTREQRLAAATQLDDRLFDDVQAFRREAQARAQEVAPVVADLDLRELAEPSLETIVRLVPASMARALAGGLEFVADHVQSIHELRASGGIGRFYADHEIEEARSRLDNFREALTRLTTGVATAGPPHRSVRSIP